jgi:Tol biopolymer transport system component
MNEDGANVVRLTNNTEDEGSPAWSPDGSMIAFTRAVDCYYYYLDYYCGRALFVMNADGSNERRLATGHGTTLKDDDPSWSPNGDAIAFTQVYCPFYCDPPSVRIVGLHGTAPALVTNHGANPAWRP